MSASTPCPEDHPLMIAWKAHQATEDFANSKKWAAYPEHLQGSLWGLFMAGFLAGATSDGREAQPARPSEPVALTDEQIQEIFDSISNDDPDVHFRFARAILASHPEPVAPEGAEPVDEKLLRSTDRADVWAKEFAKVHPEIDRGLMIGWFANCAENAKDLQRYASRPTEGQPAGGQERGVREALAELVACKDLKDAITGALNRYLSFDQFANDSARRVEYEGRKTRAWLAARRALANVETAPQAVEGKKP